MRRLLDEHGVRDAYGKQDLLISRNRSRQGAPSAGGDGIVTYVEPPKSRSNAVLGDLYNQHRVAEGKKPIPFSYCLFVNRQHLFTRRESGN